MSSIDVGDALELTLSAPTGATVVASWVAPDGTVVLDEVAVTESPAGSGSYPYTFQASTAGIWKAVFRASGAATLVEQFFVRARAIDGPNPLATVGEVAELYPGGTLTGAQESLVTVLLRRASAMVRDRWSDIDDRIAAGTLAGEMVGLAVVNMVLRVLSNPAKLKSETVGPFSRTFDTGAASGLLAITAEEMALLDPRDESGTSPARTIIARAGMAPYPEGIRRWRTGQWRTSVGPYPHALDAETC